MPKVSLSTKTELPRSLLSTAFTPALGSNSSFGRLLCQCQAVAAVIRQPVKAAYQRRSKSDALRIYQLAILEDLTATAVQIQVTAGSGGIKNPAPLVFQLFKAAAPTFTAQ